MSRRVRMNGNILILIRRWNAKLGGKFRQTAIGRLLTYELRHADVLGCVLELDADDPRRCAAASTTRLHFSYDADSRDLIQRAVFFGQSRPIAASPSVSAKVEVDLQFIALACHQCAYHHKNEPAKGHESTQDQRCICIPTDIAHEKTD